MRNHFIILQFMLITTSLVRIFANVEFDWAKSGGGGGYDAGRGIATDRAGNVFVIGEFAVQADFDGRELVSSGGKDVFVVKYDPAGMLLWAFSAGGTGPDSANAIAVDSQGNCYVTGYFQGISGWGDTNISSIGGNDIFLAKISADGNLMWLQQAGGAEFDDSGEGVALDSNGNCYITGTFSKSALFGNLSIQGVGGSHAFVAKYGTDGQPIWVRSAGQSDSEFATGIAVNRRDEIVIAGFFGKTTAFGSIQLSSAGAFDAFAATYDSSGSLRWARRFGGDGDDRAEAISIDGDDNILLGGSFSLTTQFDSISLSSLGGLDGFLTKLNINGGVIWALRAAENANGDELVWAIATSPSGNTYLTGQLGGRVKFGPLEATAQDWDAYVLKIGPAGQFDWVILGGGGGGDAGYGITLNSDEDTFLTGVYSSGNARFGAATLSLRGDNDVFVTKVGDQRRPIITVQPPSQTVQSGSDITLSVSVKGLEPFRFQWLRDGESILDATNSILVLRAVQASIAGAYKLVVSNDFGVATSQPVVITVEQRVPEIRIHPSSLNLPDAANAEFRVEAVGATRFQWFFDGKPIAGETNSNLVLRDVDEFDAGIYKVHVFNTAGTAVSTGATLGVQYPYNLGEALDNLRLVWRIGGNKPWTESLGGAGGDASASGAILDDQFTFVETVVAGPGMLTFSWMVSSERGFDALRLLIDGIEQARISGETNWHQLSFSISPGQHHLRWIYAKDGSSSAGQDRAYLDTVQYTPSAGTIFQPYLAQRQALRDGSFRMTLFGEFGQRWRIQASSNLVDWTDVSIVTNNSGGVPLRFRIEDGSRRFFRAASP